MMDRDTLKERLARIADAGMVSEPGAAVESARTSGLRRRTIRRRAVAGSAGIIIIVFAASLLLMRAAPAPREGAVAIGDSEEETTIVVSNGSPEAVLVLEPNGSSEPMDLPLAVSSTPFSTAALGSEIIYPGSDGIVRATDPRRPGRTRDLGSASYFVPGRDGDSVWLVDLSYTENQREVSNTRVRAVNVRGNSITSDSNLGPDQWPIASTADGLVVDTGTGLAHWDAQSEAFTTIVDEPVVVVASGASHVAWCSPVSCSELQITNLRTGRTSSIPVPPDSSSFAASSGRFTRDDERIALFLEDPRREVVTPAIVDLDEGTVDRVDLPSSLALSAQLTWTPGAGALFVVGQDHGSEQIRLHRYIVGTRELRTQSLPLDPGSPGPLAIVVLPAR